MQLVPFILFLISFIPLFIVLSRVCFSYIRRLLIYHNYVKMQPLTPRIEIQKDRILKVTVTYYVMGLIFAIVIYLGFMTFKSQLEKSFNVNEIIVLIISFFISMIFLFCLRVMLLCKKSNLIVLRRLPTRLRNDIEEWLNKFAKEYVSQVTDFLFSVVLGAWLSFAMYASFWTLIKRKKLSMLLSPTRYNASPLIIFITFIFILSLSFLIAYFLAWGSETILEKTDVHKRCKVIAK